MRPDDLDRLYGFDKKNERTRELFRWSSRIHIWRRLVDMEGGTGMSRLGDQVFWLILLVLLLKLLSVDL